MFKRKQCVAGLALVLALSSSALRANAQPADQPRSFPQASVRFEQNATDGDVEVVIVASARREGLTSLTVTAPDGRKIVEFTSDKPGRPNASGIRQFEFESPEPKDVESVKAAYPEGTYTFEGETESGAKLRDTATLSHELPPTTKLMYPRPEATNVSFESPKIAWAPVPDVAGYVIELEQEGTGEVTTAKLSPRHSVFVVPHGFTRPGTEYTLGIGTVSKDGNVSFIETSFTTAAAKK